MAMKLVAKLQAEAKELRERNTELEYQVIGLETGQEYLKVTNAYLKYQKSRLETEKERVVMFHMQVPGEKVLGSHMYRVLG